MKNILILYPKQFNCFEKFQRKVLRVTGNINSFSVLYLDDHNNLINRLFCEESSNVTLSKISEIDTDTITHAIVFDDGEEFLFLGRKYRIKIENISQIKPLNSSQYFSFKDKRILQIKNDSFISYIPKQKLCLDHIVLSENAKIKIADLNKYFEFKKIIFDSSNSFYKTQAWENECNQNNISFYNVLIKGAFVEYL